MNGILKGIGASRGVAVGKALLIKEQEVKADINKPSVPQEELAVLNDAVKSFCEKTERMAQKLDARGGDGEILRGHILMLTDPFMQSQMQEKIEGGAGAAESIRTVCDMFADIFSAAEDELTRQRAADVRDIRDRLLRILSGAADADLSDLPDNTVLVVSELTPSMTAGMDSAHVSAIVTEKGSKTSHCAILARAMKIPAVLSIPNALEEISDGQTLAVNGDTGEVYIAPNEDILRFFTDMTVKSEKRWKALLQMKGKHTVTMDGQRKELFANIGSDRDVAEALENDAEGIGLFRTEFLFMDRSTLPTEEEQFTAYRAAAVALQGRPLIIRTLDIGGDKEIPYLGLNREENPFLGFRAIRYCLKNEQMFRIQLRALLRASAFGDIRIMLPFVCCVEELEYTRQIINELQTELSEQSIAYRVDIPLGVMIETPAACMIADLLAGSADFFSIGTNDLTQYVMAVDRGNADVEYLYSVFQPALLRGIRNIISCAKNAHIPVGMCGESAADQRLIPLLVAFGLDEFSVNASSVLEVRENLSHWNTERAKEVAEHALSLRTEKEVRQYLESVC